MYILVQYTTVLYIGEEASLNINERGEGRKYTAQYIPVYTYTYCILLRVQGKGGGSQPSILISNGCRVGCVETDFAKDKSGRSKNERENLM